MKHVCIFSAQYLPTMGGVERYTYNIARQLTRKGVRVTIVTSQIDDLPEYEEAEEAVIYRLPSLNLMNGRFPVVILNKTSRNIMKKIAQRKYDLVITNTRFYLLSVVGTRFGRKNGKRSIVIEHGTSHMSVHNPILDVGEQCFEHVITKFVKHYSHDFYGVSYACVEWLKHFRINGKGALYNAVDMEQILCLREKAGETLRNKYNIPEDAVIISFTGRMLPEKGVIQLQEAHHEVLKKFPNTYLIYAGDGPVYLQISELRLPNVILLGKVSFEGVIELLNCSDIFCLPSVSEGMPTSVLEAIACENFVITTERGGAKEIILNDNYGIILSDNTTELVEQALIKALNDPTYRKIAVKNSYEELIKSFTWEKVAQKIMEDFL